MDIDKIEQDKDFLIIGSGGTIVTYHDQLLNFIKKLNPITIGINKMTDLYAPTYHVWTNRQRWGSLGDCISPKSTLLFGPGIAESAIRKKYKGPINRLSYNDKQSKIKYIDGMMYGPFRTAGVLAIMIAHVMGAKNIYIVGMDGYTLYPRKEIEKGKKNMHCYGKGYTDDASWDDCIKKDELVDIGLHKLKEFGVQFSIITPTKFTDFFDPTILSI